MDSNVSNVRLNLCYKLCNLNIRFEFDELLYRYFLTAEFNWNCRRYREKKEAAEPEADPERDQRTVFAYQVDWFVFFVFDVNIIRSDILGYLASFSDDCQFAM